MLRRDDLDTIGQIVSAHIGLLEQIDNVFVLADFEGPFSVDVLPQAVDGLIGSDSDALVREVKPTDEK